MKPGATEKETRNNRERNQEQLRKKPETTEKETRNSRLRDKIQLIIKCSPFNNKTGAISLLNREH